MPTRCPICPNEYTPIEGSGPEPSPFLFIGERPKKKENERRGLFVGPVGEEFDNTYLPLAGFDRSEVRVEDCVRCFADGNRETTEKEVWGCGQHFLPGVLARTRPEVVVLMGASACKLWDGMEFIPNAEVPRIRLNMHHGRPLYGSILKREWEGWVWPSYNPAVGISDTSQMEHLITDFRHLGEWWAGKWAPPIPTGHPVDYKLISTPQSVNAYMMGGGLRAAVEVAIDTESHGKEPWSIQVSHTPNTARMIRAGSKSALEQLTKHLIDCETVGIMHFAAHDLDEMDAMRVKLTPGWDGWRDTMQESYHQCALPQGLKPLVYRLFGETMRSWEDVVWPASIDAIKGWMEAASELSNANLVEPVVTQLKRGKCVECGHLHGKGPCKKEGCGCVVREVTYRKVEYRTGATEAILKHILRYVESTKDAEEPYNPWKKLPEMRAGGLRGKVPEEWEFEWLESELGPIPILGIGNCELSEAVRYGCADADFTLQAAAELKRLRGDERWKVAEEDKDQ